MLIVFIIITTLAFAWFTFVCPTDSGVNALIKLVFFAQTVFGVIVLISVLFPEARVQGTQMRWW